MPRKTAFSSQPRPVMSGAHGGTVHHNPVVEYLSHHVFLEIVLGVVALALTAWAAVVVVDGLQTYAQTQAPAVLYAYYHYYDGVEAVRARRLNVPVADRSYDAIENLRALRLVNPPLVADRSYDAIENLRALRLVNPPLVADRSYDAIENLRATRDLGD
ncbi:MAG: hypothetical protein KA764_11355 [Anaerolineales bacterium]|nr:hypothetical protein [Anaerolineales bacterium]